jgi:hypothetical protein
MLVTKKHDEVSQLLAKIADQWKGLVETGKIETI